MDCEKAAWVNKRQGKIVVELTILNFAILMPQRSFIQTDVYTVNFKWLRLALHLLS